MITDHLVPEAGIEPARTCVHWCLRPTRLPIPPFGLFRLQRYKYFSQPQARHKSRFYIITLNHSIQRVLRLYYFEIKLKKFNLDLSTDYYLRDSICNKNSLISHQQHPPRYFSLAISLRRDHRIIRHSLHYFRHSGPVIYMSKLPAPSVSMLCDYRILQIPTK